MLRYLRMNVKSFLFTHKKVCLLIAGLVFLLALFAIQSSTFSEKIYYTWHRLFATELLRVAAPANEHVTSTLSPYGEGFEKELISAFAERHGYIVHWRMVAHEEEAKLALRRGLADIAVGFGYTMSDDCRKNIVFAEPKKNEVKALNATGNPVQGGDKQLAVQKTATGKNTAENTSEKKTVGKVTVALNKAESSVSSSVNSTLAPPCTLVSGPVYGTESPLLVHSVQRHKPASLQAISGASLLISENTFLNDVLTRSLERLGDDFHIEKVPVMYLRSILHRINSNEGRFALVPNMRYRQWQPFFLNVRAAQKLSEKMPYSWVWRKDAKRLDAQLTAFWAEEKTRARVAELWERYTGFFPDDMDYYDMQALRNTMLKKMPRYSETIFEAAKENNIDPLLLAAVIYQESHFNTRAASRTGVRGLMQITLATAKDLGISNRLDPVQSIEGGARYLRSLWNRLESKKLSYWNRWYFTLAAYNQGYNHLMDAMTLARQHGDNEKEWHSIKKSFPKLSMKRWYSKMPYGYTRGYEAVDYVENIRLYYYILHGLVVLDGAESKNLRALLSVGR